MCCPDVHWNLIKLQWPASERKPSPSSSPLHQKPSAAKGYISASLSQFLGTLFNSFLLQLFLLLGGEGERLAQKPSMSLILSYESVVMDLTAKDASLSVAAGGSSDHGHPHGFRCLPWLFTHTDTELFSFSLGCVFLISQVERFYYLKACLF